MSSEVSGMRPTRMAINSSHNTVEFDSIWIQSIAVKIKQSGSINLAKIPFKTLNQTLVTQLSSAGNISTKLSAYKKEKPINRTPCPAWTSLGITGGFLLAACWFHNDQEHYNKRTRPITTQTGSPSYQKQYTTDSVTWSKKKQIKTLF